MLAYSSLLNNWVNPGSELYAGIAGLTCRSIPLCAAMVLANGLANCLPTGSLTGKGVGEGGGGVGGVGRVGGVGGGGGAASGAGAGCSAG